MYPKTGFTPPPNTDAGRPRWTETTFGAITKYDLTATFRLTKHASLYVQGRNVTNVKDRWYQGPASLPEGTGAYLRQMEEYGANWVFGVKGTF